MGTIEIIKNNVVTLIFFTLSIILLLNSIIIRISEQNASNNSCLDREKYLNIGVESSQRIKDQKIEFIQKIYPDIIKSDSIAYIFIYHEADCRNCIKTGEKLIKIIKNPSYTLYLSNKNKDTYKGSKYKVKKTEINYYLQKFQYITTPVILKFDSTFNVLDAFFPGLNQNSEFQNFINQMR